MAALVKRVGLGTRPLLPVVQAWDLDARRWVRALRRSPVKVLFPSGEVVERKLDPGKQPRKAAAEASPREQRQKQQIQGPAESRRGLGEGLVQRSPGEELKASLDFWFPSPLAPRVPPCSWGSERGRQMGSGSQGEGAGNTIHPSSP